MGSEKSRPENTTNVHIYQESLQRRRQQLVQRQQAPPPIPHQLRQEQVILQRSQPVYPSAPPPQPQRQETTLLQRSQPVYPSAPPPQPQCQETALLQRSQQVASVTSPSAPTPQPQRQDPVFQQRPQQRKQAVNVDNNHSYASSVPMLDCPVCMETMCAPILQCKRGHSLCNTCTTALRDGLCPICRDDMTGMRNFSLEDVVAEIKFDCPNKPCVLKKKRSEMDLHLKECIYREMPCPLGVANGKCSWTGTITNMLAHFEERHPASRVKLDENFKINNVKADEDERLVFLTNHGKFLFIITLRIDTLQKMCYFVIQHIGSRMTAHSFFYELQILSQVDSRRQIIFKDNCFSDVMKADEVYQLGECAMLPLSLLPHFLKNKMFAFHLSLARPGGPNNQKFQDPRPSSSNSPHPPRPGAKERGNNFKPRGRSRSKGPQGRQPKWVQSKE